MKKILTFAAVLLLGLSMCLAGCGVISKNNEDVYSGVVAKAGDVEITYEELYEMCNYVKSYNNLSSLSEEQVKKICEDLLDKKLYLDYCMRDESVLLTEKEKNYLYSQVYEAINNTIYQYEQQVKWGAVIYQTRTDSGSSANKEYKVYEAPLYYTLDEGFKVNADFKLLDTLDEKPVFEFVSNESESVKSQARINYFNALRQNAKMLGKSDLSNTALLNYEIERIYKNYYESALILKINFEYLKQNEITGGDALSLFNDLIFDDLKELVLSEKETLDGKNVINASGEDEGSIGSVALSDIEELDAYCPSIITENFFKVAHIVINDDNAFDKDKTIDEIQAEISAIFERIDNAENTQEVDDILEEIEVQAQFNGENTLQNKKLFAKESVFRTYIYKYSDDSYTTKVEYIFNKNVNSTLNASYDTNFKEKAVELYAEGEGIPGTISGVISSSESTTTYTGKHILMYLGKVQKVVDETCVLLDESHEITSEEKAELLKLSATKSLGFGHNKTLYNNLCESIIGGMKLFEGKYNSFLEARKAEITNIGKKIEYYTNKMKDLWN